ncbi:MAG: glycosyltransferase family 39 protein [Candidatus Omnitrophota bacterium]
MKFFKYAGLCSIVALGFLLRVYHLGNSSLWWDELMTVSRIDYPLVQVVRNLFISPFPPLYYILMNLWVKAFGNSEFFLRLPSLMFSVGSVIAVFYLARELFDEDAGFFSALFLSVSPYSIWFAQTAKMYSMSWFFAILSFLFFHRFTRDKRRVSLLLYVIFTTLSIYTTYIGFILILTQNILFFCFNRERQVRRWLLGQALIFLFFLPWLGIFQYNAINRTGLDWIPAVDNYIRLIGSVFPRMLTGYFGNPGYAELVICSLLIISAVVKLAGDRQKRYSISFSLLFAWIAVPVFVYYLTYISAYPILSEFSDRYIGVIHIPLIILMSRGISKYKAGYISVILVLLLGMTLLYHLRPFYKADCKMTFTFRGVVFDDNWRNLSNEIRQRAGSDPLIVTDLPPVFRYYIKGYRIEPLEYIRDMENSVSAGNFTSIFMVYKISGGRVKGRPLQRTIKGYKLEEDYYRHPNGFFWFRKIDD